MCPSPWLEENGWEQAKDHNHRMAGKSGLCLLFLASMQTLPFSDAAIQEVLAAIRSGGVVAHATETCYGLACDISNPSAVEKLFAIKQRPTHQPVSALFASVDEAKKYVTWNEKAEELAEQYLPGPLTLILPIREDAPNVLFPKLETRNLKPETIGVRVSSHPHAHSLVLMFGSPLSTTSANLHGQPNPYSAQDIEKQFADAEIKPDLILDSGVLPPTPPSTVLNLVDEEQMMRQGSVRIT